MLIDSSFKVIADTSISHGMDSPQPGWFEHDAIKVWWGDFCKLSKKLLTESGISPGDVACIGASALGTDCVPVDEDCMPLRPAILYGIDARASGEIEWLTKHYGKRRVQELFGHPICSGDTATKILWIKNHEPDVYAKTYKFLTGSSFLSARLTDRYFIDHFLAKGSFRPLYRSNGTINVEECKLFCRPEQLAQTALSTDIIGTVTGQAAEATGLMEGTPVINGTGDSTSEAISVGLVSPGTIFFQFGSSMYYYYCTDCMIPNYTSPHGNGTLNGGKVFTIPGTFCLGDGTNAAGTLTRWVRDLLYASEVEAERHGGENAYAIMAREAASVPAGSKGLVMLPYIYGERSPLQDPKATSIFIGLRGTHTRAHVNRAALEAIGYSVYQHLVLFDELGIPPRRIITAGGGTKNRTWMQIVSDMCGMDITIPEDYQCSSYGDAVLAAIGVGAINGFAQLSEVLPAGTVISPESETTKYYQAHYPMFRDLYLKNRDDMHSLYDESDTS